jgi:hypothetical protein
MTLSELSFACYCYGFLTREDKAYLKFLQVTHGTPNFRNSAHRMAIIKWLNKWGCRQFTKRHHRQASRKLLTWYEQNARRLFPRTKNIWELSNPDYEVIKNTYRSLKGLTASSHRRNGRSYRVRFGPVGAAKILFAIRPLGLAPWDNDIRKNFSLSVSAESYVTYIRKISQILEDLQPTCYANGFEISDLPQKLLRPHSSVPKLIDEYFWVTITKKWKLPDRIVFHNWSHWG